MLTWKTFTGGVWGPFLVLPENPYPHPCTLARSFLFARRAGGEKSPAGFVFMQHGLLSARHSSLASPGLWFQQLHSGAATARRRDERRGAEIKVLICRGRGSQPKPHHRGWLVVTQPSPPCQHQAQPHALVLHLLPPNAPPRDGALFAPQPSTGKGLAWKWESRFLL